MVGGAEKLVDGFAIVWKDGGTDACGDGRGLAIVAKALVNALGHVLSCFGNSLREKDNEFVASIARSGIHFTALNAKDVCQAAKRAATDKMAVGVIDFLETVHIEQQDCKRATGALVALEVRVESVEKPAVLSKPREPIGDRKHEHGFICAPMFGKFGGKGHGGYPHDANQELQQEKRKDFRDSGEQAGPQC